MKKLFLAMLLIVSVFAKNTDNQLKKAVTAFQHQEFLKAVDLAKKCANKDPRCDLFIGIIYAMKKEHDENIMQQVFDSYHNKKDPLKELNKLSPTSDPQKRIEFFYKEAEKYFKKANNPRSDAFLANLYVAGAGLMLKTIAPDYKKAKYYAQKAIKSNDKQAISTAGYLLGNMYMNGEGVLQDYKKAKEMFKKAIKAGDNESKCALGLLYIKEEKYNLAKKYLRDGYNDGEEYCAQIWNQYNLGQ